MPNEIAESYDERVSFEIRANIELVPKIQPPNTKVAFTMWLHESKQTPGPLFTKLSDVLLRDLVKSRSREIRV